MSYEGGADLKPASAGVNEVAPGKGYTVPEELKELVLTATNPGDVPVKERNKLYAAMGRLFEAVSKGKPRFSISPAQLARYTEAKADTNLMFPLLQEWVKDTTCAQVEVAERHRVTKSIYSDKSYGFYTMLDLKIKF